MADFIDKFEHELKQPIKYSTGGEHVEAKKLVVFAPTNRISQYVALIEQQFSKAVIDFQVKFASVATEDVKEKAVASKDTISDKDQLDTIITLLMSSAEVDKCFIALQKILTSQYGGKSMCLVDGIEHLTNPIYEELGYKDTKEVLAKYIENFISSSQKG